MDFHLSSSVWILVAHESGARIFGRRNPKAQIELLKRIEHPIGRAKIHDLVSDRAGRDREFSPSAGRHAVADKTDPTERNAEDFARTLARAIDIARDLNRFDSLVIVAGPRFLGLLRKSLSTATLERVGGSLTQNLGNIDDREIPKHLREFLEEFDRTAGLRSA
jgi:protein required for attachment to host cells